MTRDGCQERTLEDIATSPRTCGRRCRTSCFLGFTGTPIDKKDRSTLPTFGPYIDTYTIEQAVQDKATVPIFYESRLPDLQIIGKTLDQVFEHVFAHRTEDERAAIKQRFATEQAIAGAPRRIETICLDLIEHFTKFIAPNRFKAQVVATSRDAAVAYKETLDRLNGPESVVVMSAGHNDEARLARWHLPKDQQEQAIDRFKDRNDPLSILVVCDMLLTGFDAPVEQGHVSRPAAERGRAAAAADPPRGGHEVLPVGCGHERPERLRAGAGARGRAGRLRPRVPPLQPIHGHAAAGSARPVVSRRPPLAGARFGGLLALASGTTGSTCRAAARRCGS